MLYHLFEYLDKHMHFPGSGLFHYLSFRAALSILISLTISMVFGKNLIRMLRKKQVAGTPTMGGLIILAAILVPTLLLADLTNIYIQTMIIATIWLGLIGFLDDYIKVFKKNKEGLAGKSKIVGQIGVGIIVASMLYWNPSVTIKEKVSDVQIQNATTEEQAMQWEEEKELLILQ